MVITLSLAYLSVSTYTTDLKPVSSQGITSLISVSISWNARRGGQISLKLKKGRGRKNEREVINEVHCLSCILVNFSTALVPEEILNFRILLRSAFRILLRSAFRILLRSAFRILLIFAFVY